jgi:hypothetical protein
MAFLKDATRPPRRKPLTAEKIKQVVEMTLYQTPPAATHWRVRTNGDSSGHLLLHCPADITDQSSLVPKVSQASIFP